MPGQTDIIVSQNDSATVYRTTIKQGCFALGKTFPGLSAKPMLCPVDVIPAF